MLRDVRRLALAVLAAAAAGSALPSSTAPITEATRVQPAGLLADLRTVRPQPAEAVALRRVDIELGPATLEIAQGVLVPARSERGRVVELLFVGQARLRLTAPDAIEASQLELFTGERSLDAPVEEAVLVLGNPEAARTLLARPPPRELRPELARRIAELHERWLQSAERRRAGVEASLFKALAGDGVFQSFFAAWFRSFELGDFVLQLDPEEIEPITVAGFQPLELGAWERARLRHQIRVEQRKERWLNVRLEDLGTWDVWLSSAWQPTGGGVFPGNSGFEVRHYELDVTLRKRKGWIDGRARLDLDVQTSGRRVVRLELFGDLVVESVAEADGRELFFFRDGDTVVVHLPEPSVAGQTLRLDVVYGGRALSWVRGNVFDLQESETWYPHCGTVDRATYDVKLRWPEGRQLVSSGRLVASGRDGGWRWERRRVDVPAIGVSFMIGKFDMLTRRVGHVDVRLALTRDSRVSLDPRMGTAVLDAVADSLAYFEGIFGPYPLDELTIVTVPRQYSQSYLGFITFAESMLRLPDPFGAGAEWQRATTIAHEVAHQWWGNLVGWWSYRDQWLSEGMANYAALLYDGHRDAGGHDRLGLMSSGWRESLALTTLDGRTIESLGPIVLGSRLNSSRAENAYRTIVYRKGGAVLAMLARAVGEERFLEMLRTLVEIAAGRVLTTANFIEAVERMSGLDLEGFAQQFVYGTGIPEVYYAYDAAPDDLGGWVVEGEARLLPTPRYGHRIVPVDAGQWDVERTPGPRSGAPTATLVVPYHLTLARANERQVHGGQLLLSGRRADFRIEIEHEPLELELDPGGEILAWFYAAERHPKRVLRFEAEDLAVEGRIAEARALYERALGLPGDGPSRADPLSGPPEVPVLDARIEDLRIRLALVRLRLAGGDAGEAARELARVEGELHGNDAELLRMEREVLHARLEMVGDDLPAAHRRLKRTLRLANPEFEHRQWRDVLAQMQLNAERPAMAEAYGLLLITAQATGQAEDRLWARREARDRGVDVSLFPAEEEE